MARPKIALLYVGGSIGFKANQKTGRMEPIESLNEIHRFLPELQREVALSFFSLTNVGSSEVTAEVWIEISQTIEKLYNDFDGFVVVHGTNTMSYTAAALGFALQGLGKPVVLTGSLMPINDIAGDGRLNLILAIRAAQLDIAEVCVVLGPKVLRGVRARKVDQSMLHTFDSPKYPPLADFSTETTLHPWRMVRRKRTLVCKPNFNTNVVVVTLHPGVQEQYLQAVLDAKPDGIVLRAYGPGMIPESLFDWIRKAEDMDIPVVITSQTVRGAIDLHRYRKQLRLEQLGVICGKNITGECAIVKLMWALANAKGHKRVKDLFEKNLVGEFDE